MKRLAILGAAATLLLVSQVQPQAADAKSLGSMINSAVNELSGRSSYYNQFRYGNPYYSGYGYGYGGYGAYNGYNPYLNYNYGYGYNPYVNNYSNYSNPYYGYNPYGWY